jgi:hypothetical protein
LADNKGVVNLYQDDSLLTPSKHDSERDWITLFSEPAPSVSSPVVLRPKPSTAKRAPLTSKLSNDIINLPPSTPKPRGKKGSKTSTISDDGSDIVFLEKTKSAVVKPKTTKPKAKQSGPRKEVLDGVVLPATKSSSRNSASAISSPVSDITEDVANLSIEAIEPTLTTPLDEFHNLVSACTSTEVHDFSTFISSPAVVSLLDPESKPSGPSFVKIGEASYSEVYSMGILQGKKIVIKVIPLVDHDNEVTGRQDGDDLPETSYAKDVLRELEITQRMGAGEGATRRFVKFLG